MKNSEVSIGLSGGSTKGHVHVGVLEYLDDAGIHVDKIIGKSIGAIVAAAYMVLKQEYSEKLEKLKGFESPAYKLEHMLAENGKLLRFFTVREIGRNFGFIDSKPVEEFLKRVLEERTFNDIKGLYIVAHNLGNGEDVIFGKVKKDYPVWKAALASASIPGLMESGIEEEGNILVDGCISRKSPLKELYEQSLGLKVCVFLGYFMGAKVVYAEKSNDTTNGVSRVRFVKRLKDRFLWNLEAYRLTNASRERKDLVDDIKALTGKSLEDVIEGKEKGLILVLPKHEHIKFTEHSKGKYLVDVGYRETAEAFERYKKQQNSDI